MAEETVQIDPVTGKQIPMKDGKPCRVCVDFKTWSKIEKKSTKTNKTATAATSQPEPTESKVAETVGSDVWKEKNCPADVATLGKHTWTLLHTMAAYYPEKPEPKQKESMKTFFESFAQHYPCWFCKVNYFLRLLIHNEWN